MQEAAFRIETNVEAGRPTIAVWGELDSGTSEALAEASAKALEGGPADLRLDLSGVSFIDSAGMRTMISIEQAARGRGIRVVVTPPPDDVTELITRAGLNDHLEFANTAHAFDEREYIERIEFQLDPGREAPRRGRSAVRELLAGRLDESASTTAILLTSELVTNAVIHPERVGRSILLRTTLYDDGIRVEVADSGAGFDPAALRSAARIVVPGEITEGGRGLLLVDRCSARWGVRRQPAELGMPFVVWFELDDPAAAEQLTA